ncbi:hypothetical protein [Marinomonas sp.]
MKIWGSSKPWFWKLRKISGNISFAYEKNAYKSRVSFIKSKENANILGSFAFVGVRSLLGVIFFLAVLISAEYYIRSNFPLWLPAITPDEKKFNIEQLRLYSQLLTAIFSIYFATIGIIISAGYTKLRRDIILMLTSEQVGSVYSTVLVFSAIFCLTASALPTFNFELGLFVYITGTFLTLLSTLALFPLGQRLFNFFDLNQLISSEILLKIKNDIAGVVERKNSNSLANHYFKQAHKSLEQFSYINECLISKNEGLKNNLSALTDIYMYLLLHYLLVKRKIDQDSYWFPRKKSHQQWFFAGDTVTSMAINTKSQQPLIKEKIDYQWVENEIISKLTNHIDLAFQIGDLDLSLKLITRFSDRVSVYTTQFQFETGMRELKKIKEIIELSFSSSNSVTDHDTSKIKMTIADTWAALGSNLCLGTLRQIMTFDGELKNFFEIDEWNKQSLRRLPPFLQIELDFIVKRIEFEYEIEGARQSKPKYLQQLTVQILLQYYARILPMICDFYQNLIPNFVHTLKKQGMKEAATQVDLASLHSHWKLPNWLGDINELIERYKEYEYYAEDHYKLPDINVLEMIQQLNTARESAIYNLSDVAMVGHIFQPHLSDESPDHFGQIYFELAEECINALEKNDVNKLDKIFPTLMKLAFIAADLRFVDPNLKVNDKYRFHLISTVINDLASILGFSILYGAYFDNEKLSEHVLTEFESWVGSISDKQQYLKRMLFFSDSRNVDWDASPRSMIRINWKQSFENRVRNDGFESQLRFGNAKQHKNKIVRVFLQSHSDASHLFFAVQVVPQIEVIDSNMDRNITDLARYLLEGDG